MKILIKSLVAILVVTICLVSTTTLTSASEYKVVHTEEIITFEPYVSDTFKIDPKYAQKVKRKQEAAESYYNAIVKGDFKLAAQYKDEFEQISNPTLYQMRKDTLNTQTSVRNTYPSNWRIPDLYQYPQEKSYWCGCAAAKSILQNIGITKSQAELAGNSYLQTERFGNTPWYITNGDSPSEFPMATTLVNAQFEVSNYAFGYKPSPLGAAGANPLTVEQCKAYVMSTTSAFDDGYGVAACGTSKGSNSAYRLPGYPSYNIGHWVVSDGYKDNGDYIWIVDPAKSDVISWSNSISAYYNISATLFRNFVSPRGIVW